MLRQMYYALIYPYLNYGAMCWGNNYQTNLNKIILGHPGATSRDDAIFSGKSLFQELKSPWELTLTEPVPEVVGLRPADWAEKYISAQSAKTSSRVTLSPSYKK